MPQGTSEPGHNGRADLQWLFQQPRSMQAALVVSYLELAVIVLNSLFEMEVRSLAGPRYSRTKPFQGRYQRWGSNPGSVRIGAQRVPVEVPRVYDTETRQHRPLDTYTAIRTIEQPSAAVMQSILHGMGTRNYGKSVETIAESFGLSKSQISETFKEHSAAALKMFMERRFDQERFVALLLDGKAQQGEQMVIALGVTRLGVKIPLGFVQATTENATSCSELLRDLLGRGLTFEDGILVLIDGSKGLRKAVDDVFGAYAVVGRCQFHKRQNVVGYLPEADRSAWSKRIGAAMALADEHEARMALERCRDDLRKINVSAAHSLEEGLDECLVLQRLGMCDPFHAVFATTNSIETLNSQVSRYTRHVTRWSTSDQRHRWIAVALLEAERNTRRVIYAEKLPQLQAAITNAVQRRIQQQTLNSFSHSQTSPFSTKKRT